MSDQVFNPLTDDTIPAAIRRQILLSDLQMWLNTAWSLKLRHKVNKKIGTEPAILKQIEDDMIKSEGAIEMYRNELTTLDKEEEGGK